MKIFQRGDFEPRRNETFELLLGESGMPLTLSDVKALTVHPFPGMLRDPFSLVFRSASPLILPQRIYRLTNAAMGDVDIFIVPVARDAGGVVYEAVFN